MNTFVKSVLLIAVIALSFSGHTKDGGKKAAEAKETKADCAAKFKKTSAYLSCDPQETSPSGTVVT